MMDLLNELVKPGTEFIIFIQSFRTSSLDFFFRYITFLGDEEFYLLLFPVIYLTVNKYWSRGLAYLLLFSTYISLYVKDFFSIPRPFDLQIEMLTTETSPSFPSSHAQNGLVLWSYLGIRMRRWYLWFLILPLIILISLSRIYLGVHFPQDILGGLVIGIILLTIWEELVSKLRSNNTLIRLALALFIPLILLFLYHSESGVVSTGALLGVSIGFYFEDETISFSTKGSIKQKVLRLLIAIPLIFITWIGLKYAFPSTIIFIFIRYFLIGFTMAYLTPLILLKVSLVEKGS